MQISILFKFRLSLQLVFWFRNNYCKIRSCTPAVVDICRIISFALSLWFRNPNTCYGSCSCCGLAVSEFAAVYIIIIKHYYGVSSNLEYAVIICCREIKHLCVFEWHYNTYRVDRNRVRLRGRICDNHAPPPITP